MSTWKASFVVPAIERLPWEGALERLNEHGFVVTSREVSRNDVRMIAETSPSSARPAENNSRILPSAGVDTEKRPDCARTES